MQPFVVYYNKQREESKMTLGDLIKAYRAAHGLTMQEFANLSGLSKAYVSMLEKNKHPQNNKELFHQ